MPVLVNVSILFKPGQLFKSFELFASFFIISDGSSDMNENRLRILLGLSSYRSCFAARFAVTPEGKKGEGCFFCPIVRLIFLFYFLSSKPLSELGGIGDPSFSRVCDEPFFAGSSIPGPVLILTSSLKESHGNPSYMKIRGRASLWWSGDNKFLVIPTFHWRPDDQRTERVPRFRALCFRAHLV